ncbi:GNAT family N-acetyltransferase [Neorhizobium lilium]|uniref:GNAT family N-acetyltransferase n=1 Tax=Neorhizobium lilium TaxID=2503024 RepID=A0A444LBE3_9HYPH|nr:GNAT family N-acetyltransferase [Neorhizobium lilium]RWX75013.1 GNAT family N-acetyltransferase [Neorhizobium lilium]
MSGDDLIRALTLPEVEMLLDWARVEGWNPGLQDASAFHAADPEGFIGCFVDGGMAAGISAVRYDAGFGFIGLYIAHPNLRGKGYGRRVWEAGMQHLAGRTIGLDGVPEQQANYRSMGFEPAYATHRWSGFLDGFDPVDVTDLPMDRHSEVVTYDAAMFPAERDAFLKQWLSPPRIGKLLVRDGRIEGYAVCRQCHDGWKIGPLFADCATDAERLLQACASHAKDGPLQIDVPETQRDFATCLQELGFSRGFTTARMYRGPQPAVRMDKVFGITTLELG